MPAATRRSDLSPSGTALVDPWDRLLASRGQAVPPGAIDPSLLTPRQPDEPVRVWLVPSCPPEERLVDPRLGCDPSPNVEAMRWQEANILAAEGSSPNGAVEMDVRVGSP